VFVDFRQHDGIISLAPQSCTITQHCDKKSHIIALRLEKMPEGYLNRKVTKSPTLYAHGSWRRMYL